MELWIHWSICITNTLDLGRLYDNLGNIYWALIHAIIVQWMRCYIVYSTNVSSQMDPSV